MLRSVRRAARGALALLLALFAAGGMAAAPAYADGDPASDVLLVQNVFYPYQPKVPAELESALERALAETGRGTGVHFKVAIILTAPELGLVPQYFGRPQAYARFLDREISFNSPQPLITVMPQGLGVMPARYAPALAGMSVDRGLGSDGLTQSAIAAVVALSRHLGHPIPTPSVRASGASGSSAPALAFALPAALLLAGGLFATVRRRRRSSGG